MGFLDGFRGAAELTLEQNAVVPGETIRGIATVRVKKTMTISAIDVTLLGQESCTVGKNTQGSNKVVHGRHSIICNTVRLAGSGSTTGAELPVLMAGQLYEYPVLLHVPSTMPPTIEHNKPHFSIRYTVEVHVRTLRSVNIKASTMLVVLSRVPRQQLLTARPIVDKAMRDVRVRNASTRCLAGNALSENRVQISANISPSVSTFDGAPLLVSVGIDASSLRLALHSAKAELVREVFVANGTRWQMCRQVLQSAPLHAEEDGEALWHLHAAAELSTGITGPVVPSLYGIGIKVLHYIEAEFNFEKARPVSVRWPVLLAGSVDNDNLVAPLTYTVQYHAVTSSATGATAMPDAETGVPVFDREFNSEWPKVTKV